MSKGIFITATGTDIGKTFVTALIVKKLRDVAQYCETHYGKHAGFACLSFTNKACDELKDKYQDMHDERLSFPNMVSTIDSFIMQTVVLPFWYLCDLCKKKPIVVNENNLLDRIYYNNVWRGGVLQSFLVNELRPFSEIIHTK